MKVSRMKVATLRADKFIFALVVGLLTVTTPTQSLRAQGFDCIERERALAMLSTIKDQLKKSYYDRGQSCRCGNGLLCFFFSPCPSPAGMKKVGSDLELAFLFSGI
jgi:hypothetical protein